MLKLYENIKIRREELGMSQQELADRTGYTSRSSIAKIEAGERDIPQSKIISFANALSTTPSVLMGWSASGNPLDKELEGIDFALQTEVKEMSDAQKRDVLKFARFLKEQSEE